jgi:hypothetical protein
LIRNRVPGRKDPHESWGRSSEGDTASQLSVVTSENGTSVRGASWLR